LTSRRSSRAAGRIPALQRFREALDRRQHTAFVFSGGGNLGAVQVGMLRALVEHGVEPDAIVGCSVGAINGAAFASEPTLRGLIQLDRLWSGLADGRPDLMPESRLPVAVQMAMRRRSLHDPEVLRAMLEKELTARSFAELKVPFACVATRLNTADQHWFAEGPLIPALMASAALPAVYPPVEIDGELFMDGGVVSEAPVDQAAAMGARRIYLLHVGHLSELRRLRLDRPFDAALHAYWMARMRRFEDDCAGLGDRCELIRLPAGPLPELRFDDFSQGRSLAAQAHELSSRFLDQRLTSEQR
jgi:NTE family protein